MIYLLFGTVNYLIDEYINNILSKEKIDDINICKYFLDNNLKDIVEDAMTISLFSPKKAIIVEANNLFSQKKDNSISLLENYLSNYNESTILILVVREQTIDSRRKVYKLINEKGKVVEFNKNVNVYDYVKKHFKDYTISNETINLLVKRVGNDLNLLKQEINKLKIYKINDKLIINDDVINLCSKNIDTNIFKFIDNIISKNKKEAIKNYHLLLKSGEEPIKIIVILANQFRLMYQVKMLNKQGYSEDNMASTLKMKRYPIHLALQNSYKYTSDILLDNLERLADLDIKIKTGEADKNIALELFLLSL